VVTTVTVLCGRGIEGCVHHDTIRSFVVLPHINTMLLFDDPRPKNSVLELSSGVS